jgi:hypothetical protein
MIIVPPDRRKYFADCATGIRPTSRANHATIKRARELSRSRTAGQSFNFL